MHPETGTYTIKLANNIDTLFTVMSNCIPEEKVNYGRAPFNQVFAT